VGSNDERRIVHTSILVLATTAPGDSGSLRPGLDADQVSPGFLGFLFTLFVVVIMFFLIRDMVKRIRRVRYRAQVEERATNDGGGTAAGTTGGTAAGAVAGPDARHRPGGSHGPDVEVPGSDADGR
jgi:hypothetical protein